MLTFENIEINLTDKHLLITGIANCKKLLQDLDHQNIVHHHVTFQDHYKLKEHDIIKLIRLKNELGLSENLLLTEKDYYRLSKKQLNILEKNFNLICIQIEFDFIEPDKSNFTKQLLTFDI